VEWMAGVFVVRALTGRPMPPPEDAERLADVTLRAILEGWSGSWPHTGSESQLADREFGDPSDLS
jgi:hypothetical protein